MNNDDGGDDEAQGNPWMTALHRPSTSAPEEGNP